eukprot:CAMPEP_0181057300 /NCGR_PEP_ID=MMETSP1070-20121207/20175_1 /TAXON_ID=265543 /ORGANISM="Minutocellus polymorphus, Strain NH13" /LENGTH=494 /DNA_ID=CAMNT_0023136701 /DNA_START=61 /DNA_END=1542 /DNA_ORIENTATION=+
MEMTLPRHESISSLPFAGRLTPRARAVGWMALATGAHFAAYELARSATLAIFTSKKTGFESSSALPLAVGCVSPFSVLLLSCYSYLLDKQGPRTAIRLTTHMFAVVLLICSLLLCLCRPDIGADDDGNNDATQGGYKRNISRATIFTLFVYQNASVRLLHSQHWSFISSVTLKSEAKVWFAPITGLASLTSTISAGSISYLLENFNLFGLLGIAASLMLVGSRCSDNAYRTAAIHNFTPTKESDDRVSTSSTSKTQAADVAPGREKWHDNEVTEDDSSASGKSLFSKARTLFRRVPILGALFLEVLLCQSLSSLLNFLFLVKTKEAIPNDEERAGWSGKCYAWTNGVSGFLQFVVMPIAMKWVDPRYIWLVMPSTMIVLVLRQCLETNPSLLLVGLSFFWMKTQEYSFRPVVSELIYVTMDFESRYLGKEVINLMADRMGKSGMAMALFVASTFYDEQDLLSTLSNVAFVAASVWCLSSLRLVRLISPGRWHSE